jgi:hypothetical protein
LFSCRTPGRHDNQEPSQPGDGYRLVDVVLAQPSDTSTNPLIENAESTTTSVIEQSAGASLLIPLSPMSPMEEVMVEVPVPSVQSTGSTGSQESEDQSNHAQLSSTR